MELTVGPEGGFLFDPRCGDTYALNRTGAFILAALREGRESGEIARDLARRFAVEDAAAGHDVEDFIQRLQALGVRP